MAWHISRRDISMRIRAKDGGNDDGKGISRGLVKSGGGARARPDFSSSETRTCIIFEIFSLSSLAP